MWKTFDEERSRYIYQRLLDLGYRDKVDLQWCWVAAHDVRVWVVVLLWISSIRPFQSSGKDVYQKPPNDPIGSSSSSDQVVGILQAVTFILRKHCKRKTSNMIRIWFLDPFFPVHKSLEQWDPAVLVPTRRWNLKARMSPTLYVSLFFIHVCTYPIFHRFYQLVFAFYRLCTCVWRHFLLYTTSYVWI